MVSPDSAATARMRPRVRARVRVSFGPWRVGHRQRNSMAAHRFGSTPSEKGPEAERAQCLRACQTGGVPIRRRQKVRIP